MKAESSIFVKNGIIKGKIDEQSFCVGGTRDHIGISINTHTELENHTAEIEYVSVSISMTHDECQELIRRLTAVMNSNKWICLSRTTDGVKKAGA